MPPLDSEKLTPTFPVILAVGAPYIHPVSGEVLGIITCIYEDGSGNLEYTEAGTRLHEHNPNLIVAWTQTTKVSSTGQELAVWGNAILVDQEGNPVCC